MRAPIAAMSSQSTAGPLDPTQLDVIARVRFVPPDETATIGMIRATRGRTSGATEVRHTPDL